MKLIRRMYMLMRYYNDGHTLRETDLGDMKMLACPGSCLNRLD